jgi:hypothetical protein
MSKRSQDVVSSEPKDGLFLRGIVTGRTRKAHTNKETGELRYQYNYTVATSFGPINVSCWGDHEFIPVGTAFDRAVVARAYVPRGGGARVSYSLPGNDSTGEAF